MAQTQCEHEMQNKHNEEKRDNPNSEWVRNKSQPFSVSYMLNSGFNFGFLHCNRILMRDYSPRKKTKKKTLPRWYRVHWWQVVIRHTNVFSCNCHLLNVFRLSFIRLSWGKSHWFWFIYHFVHYSTSFQLNRSFFFDGKATQSGSLHSVSCSTRILLPEFFALH